MRTRLLPLRLPLLLVLAVVAQASAGTPDGDLVIDCTRPELPRQVSVARATGLHNVGQAYAARARLMAQVRRECLRDGVRHVRVVRTAGPDAADALASC